MLLFVLTVVAEFEEAGAVIFGFVSEAELCDPSAVRRPRFETTGAGEFLQIEIDDVLRFKFIKMYILKDT